LEERELSYIDQQAFSSSIKSLKSIKNELFEKKKNI
jgi:hypothetical protein